MNKIKVLATFTLLCLSLTMSAQSDNQANYAKAWTEFNKGHYTKARNLCSKVLATGDIKYTTKCQSLISTINKKEAEDKVINEIPHKQKTDYISVPSLICLPFGTTSQDVSVKASGSWNAHTKSSWIRTKASRKNLTITAIEQNATTQKKKSTVTVECGELTRTITVEQEGAPEVLEYKSKYLKVPYKGGQFIVDINTNTKWKVDYADWYKALPLNGDSTRMIITIDKNTKNEDRNGSIIVRSESGDSYDQLEVYQYANESNIFTAVDSIIQVGVKGDTLTVPVICDNPTWTPSDCPSWCKENKLSADTLQLIVVPNENYLSREGFANIKSNDRVSGILIKQDAREIPSDIIPKTMPGKNISFGIAAGYTIPFVSTTASGDYTGSVINYGLGNNEENLNISGSTGFTIGILADFRLHKNLYLTSGINYNYYKYNNTFNADVERRYANGAYTVAKGTFKNSFKETYTFHNLSLPILASYRFVLSKSSFLHVNCGPVLYYSFKASLEYSGTSDCDELYTHKIINNKIGDAVGNAYSSYTKYDGSMDLYSNTTHYSIKYTDGTAARTDVDYKSSAAPYNRFNVGLQFGINYEYSNFIVGLSYTHLLTNMANSNFWDGNRIPIFNQTPSTQLSGFKQHNHSLEIKIGYILRNI